MCDEFSDPESNPVRLDLSARATVRGYSRTPALEACMPITLSLTEKNGSTLDARKAILLAYALLAALAELLRGTQRMTHHTFVPRFLGSSITIEGEMEHSPDLFDGIDAVVARIGRASALLAAAEQLLKTHLADRMIKPSARLPIAVKHSAALDELLAYDACKDEILCNAADWREVVSANVRMLKALANIVDAGLIPRLEIGGTAYTLPHVSPSVFGHGTGAGHSVISTGDVSGLYLVAGEIEVRIDGLRERRVIRAELDDHARQSAITHHPPYTVAMQYWESAPYLPLLPGFKPRVVIERMWEFQSPTEFVFPES
jgi:hypothetical protein